MSEMVFYKDSKGCHVLKWLDQLPKRAFAKAFVRLERLADLGHNLRRPEADYLRDGIYELRWRQQKVNYRILYSFNGKELVVLLHGITKEKEVPNREIETAIKRLSKFKGDPKKYTYQEDLK